MNRVIFKHLVSAVACLLLLIVASNASGQNRRALLIGVNEYQTEEFADLRGAVNDVITMREILVSRYGFPEDAVTTLTDQAATRRAILDAFDALVEQSGADDFIYVHYSGHGSQVKDLNGDEDDDTDETILPHDGRTEGVPDITDDEIGNFLRRLSAKNAIIVLDSCHSGTATRGGIATRSVPADDRLELYADTTNAVATRAIVALDMPDQYILFSGAAANQSALDGAIEGKFRGFFSYALAEALKNVEPNASPQVIHNHVSQTYERLSQLTGGLPLPEPQFEANPTILDKPLFAESRSAAVARVFLTMTIEDGARGRLKRGSSLDALPGNVWAVFSDNEAEFRLDEALATAVVVSLDNGDSIVDIDGISLNPDRSYRAVPLPKPLKASRVPVRLEAADVALGNDLRSYLADRVSDIAFVNAGEFARFVVTVDSNKVGIFDASGLVQIDQFQFASLASTGDKLASILNRSKSAVSLTQMINPASKLTIDARIAGMAAANEMRIRQGSEPRSHQNSLMLEIVVNADSYLTVLDIDPEGAVTALFPYDDNQAGFLQDGFVKAGGITRIPDSLAPDNRADFYWDYAPPAGLDTIQVFATTDLATATMIRSWIAALNTVTARGNARSADYSQPLAELQNRLAKDVRTRAVRVVRDNPGTALQSATADATVATQSQPDWNSVSLSIRVSE